MKLTRPRNTDFSRTPHEMVDWGILASISGDAIKVYVAISRYADYVTRSSKPTRATIAKKSGVNKNKLTSAIRQLEACGLIEVKRTGRNFSYRNIYTIIEHPVEPDADILSMYQTRRRSCPADRDSRTGQFSRSAILKTVRLNGTVAVRSNGHTHLSTAAESSTCTDDGDKKEIERERKETAEADSINSSDLDPEVKNMLLKIKSNIRV